jgi:regulatory protein
VSSPSALFPPADDSTAPISVDTDTGIRLDTVAEVAAGGIADAAPVIVTALRESPRAPGRYAITLSDGRSFIVPVAALAETGATRVGATLDPDAVSRLVREAAISDLSARALGMLARARRTRRELELRLRKRETDPSIIGVALDRLEAQGFIADQEAARAEASARLRRGEAPARVRMTLRTKGIGGRDAEAAVSEAMHEDAFDERAACHAVAEKKLRTMAALQPDVARRRLIGFLQRRGFGGTVIRDVLDTVRRSGDSH